MRIIKRMSIVVVAALLTCLMTAYVFAAGDVSNGTGSKGSTFKIDAARIETITYEKDIPETEQVLVKLTRPAADESTFRTSYIISGCAVNTITEHIIVTLYRYSTENKCYIPFDDIYGENNWEIGSFFSKEIELGKGKNEIMIVAYKKPEPRAEIKFLQVNKFTITVLDENLKDLIKKGIVKTFDFIKNLFDN
jgi:hypothetical protein